MEQASKKSGRQRLRRHRYADTAMTSPNGKPIRLVVVRHGQSTWNQENKFTGWRDVDLTARGEREARSAAETLKQDGFKFDVVFTSMLKRSIRTAWIMLNALDLTWIPIEKTWRLNERHYGELEGLSKSGQAVKHGEEQVEIWRRSFDVRPPQVRMDDPRNPRLDPRYADVETHELPTGESLKDVVARFVPYWDARIVPVLKQRKSVLIVAHGNSLRALVKHLENVSDAEITRMNLPTGMPRVYELDSEMSPVSSSFAASEDEVQRRIAEVVKQGKPR